MRPFRTIVVIVALAAALVATAAPAQTKSAEDDFLSWARGGLHPVSTASGASQADLEPFRKIVGSARVVAVGEAFHGTAEGMAFRNRLFRYLVENLGFRVIAIESGITEGRVVHDYVAGAPGDIGTVMQQGISWGFDRFPQNEELVKWMREWNADPRHQQKLEFFGFDVPGSAGNPFGRRDVRTALEETSTILRVSMPRTNRCSADVWQACGHAFGWCPTRPTSSCRRRSGTISPLSSPMWCR